MSVYVHVWTIDPPSLLSFWQPDIPVHYFDHMTDNAVQRSLCFFSFLSCLSADFVRSLLALPLPLFFFFFFFFFDALFSMYVMR